MKPARKKWGTGGYHPIDVHVGSRVRLRRKLLNMSQTELGKHVGLTFQQIQKYERGANRIGASRLYQFSKILDVPLSFFFDGYEAGDKAAGLAEDQASFAGASALADDPLRSRETRALVDAYYAIPSRDARLNVLDLVRAVARSEDELD